MNRSFKTLVLSVAVAATTLGALPAQAGGRWDHHGRRPVPEYRGPDRDGMLAAGLVGLALGAIVVGATTRPQPQYQDEYDRNPYRHPRPSVDRDYFPVAPAPVVYDDDSYEPWSADWYQYCTDQYRSFNPRTGTYTAYTGEQRFCVAQ